jgi:copper resistance protein C
MIKGDKRMKKIVTVFILFLIFLPTNSLAHTDLKDSYPQKNEVVTAPLTDIILTFQSKVEIGSYFELTNEDKEGIKPDNLSIDKNLLKGVFNEPLTNGSYTLNWFIIGADGHLIKGEIPFSVRVEAIDEGDHPIQSEKKDSEEQEMTKNSTEEMSAISSLDNPSTQNVMTKAVDTTKENQNDSVLNQKNKSISYIILYSGIGVAILFIAILLWRLRKKR